MSLAKQWLLRVAIRKVVTRVVVYGLAAYGAHLASWGLQVNEPVLTASAIAGIELALDWVQLKLKKSLV